LNETRRAERKRKNGGPKIISTNVRAVIKGGKKKTGAKTVRKSAEDWQKIKRTRKQGTKGLRKQSIGKGTWQTGWPKKKIRVNVQ